VAFCREVLVSATENETTYSELFSTICGSDLKLDTDGLGRERRFNAAVGK
jgi:hypothetical protein